MSFIWFKLLLGLSLSFCIQSDAKIHLRYFDSRGRAEPIRLLLAALELSYEETVFTRCEGECPEGLLDWPTYKEKHVNTDLLPFGQVPSLTFTDPEGKETHIVQSLAIQQFLARKYDLFPNDNVAVDILTGGIEDMRKKYGSLVYSPTFDDEQLEKYKAETLKMWLPFFERLLQNSEGQWFVGGKLSFVDTMAFDMLESNLRIDPKCLDELPALSAFVKKVTSVPGVKAYLQSNGRRAFSNGNFAAYDTPNNPIPKDPIKEHIEKEL
mmetsp:Transcript_7894/g.9508  ORF Transcript_7894/g.9508 Transcript_7894/m.9508 type:complete len:267 (-) Transcript_7894:1214-2014(-)